MNKTVVCHISVDLYHINVKPVKFNLIKLTGLGFLILKEPSGVVVDSYLLWTRQWTR